MGEKISFNRQVSGLFCAGLFVMSTSVSAQTVTTPGAGTIDCTDVTIDYADDPNLTEAEKLARMDEAFQRSLSKFDLCQTVNQSGQQSGSQGAGQDAGSTGQTAGASGGQQNTAADTAAQDQANGDTTTTASGTTSSTSQAPAGSSWGPPPEMQSSLPPAQDSAPDTGSAAAESDQEPSDQQSTATSDLSGPNAPPEAADQSLPGLGTGSDSTDGVAEGSVASSDMTGTEPPPQAPSAPPIPDIPDIPGTEDTASIDQDTSGASGPNDAMDGNKQLSNGKLPEDIPPADNDSVLEAQIRQAAINEKDPAVQKRLWNEYRKYKGLPTVN